jgi:hypothetical protein
VYNWAKERVLDRKVVNGMRNELGKNGKKVSDFFYGASLYEYGDMKQNVCLTTGLTKKEEGGDKIRQLIFFPSGKLITDWRYDTEAEGKQMEERT